MITYSDIVRNSVVKQAQSVKKLRIECSNSVVKRAQSVKKLKIECSNKFIY